MQVLEELFLLTGRSTLVFPGERHRDRPMSENTVNAALRAMGYSKDEMTAHGFRATARFTVLVLAQLFNCFNARSETSSAFANLFVNKWLWGAIAVSILLQVAVVHLDFLNIAFGTMPLTLDQWIVCGAMASFVLWSSELGKLVERAWSRRRVVATKLVKVKR